MDVSHHIAFRHDKHPQFAAYLVENKFPKLQKGETFYSFDVFESDPLWPYIEKYITEHDIFSLKETFYTKDELQQAQFLRLWCRWCNGYPQPEGKFMSITYSQSYCKKCESGLCQIAPFRIRKSPNWGTRHFMMLNWVLDELFMDDTAKEVLSSSGLQGISFRPVEDKNGKQTLPNIWQWDIPYVLPAGLCYSGRAIDRVLYCESCGKVKYHPTGIGMRSFKKEIFQDAPDVMKSEEIFGFDVNTSKMIIVSQKVYQTLTNHHLDRALVFEPINLV